MRFCLDDGSALLEGPASIGRSGDEPVTAIFSQGASGFPGASDARRSSPGQADGIGNSIAVLPFVNMSADAENEYFCDGLAEELLNALAKISDLRVAARTSAFSFKGKNANVAEIADALKVKAVLEGKGAY